MNGITKITVKGMTQNIAEHLLYEKIFTVEFKEGIMLEITTIEECKEYKVTNGVNGYGGNVKAEFENEKVTIE